MEAVVSTMEGQPMFAICLQGNSLLMVWIVCSDLLKSQCNSIDFSMHIFTCATFSTYSWTIMFIDLCNELGVPRIWSFSFSWGFYEKHYMQEPNPNTLPQSVMDHNILLLFILAATYASVFWIWWFYNQLASHSKYYCFACYCKATYMIIF